MNEKIGTPDNQIKTTPEDKEKEIERLTFEDLKLRLQDLIQGNPKKINDKILKFAKRLRIRYQDSFKECVLYHVLCSHNYGKNNYTFFDFPDDDSVEEFIKELEEERADKGDEEKSKIRNEK